MSKSLQKNNNGNNKGNGQFEHLSAFSLPKQEQGGGGMDPKIIVATLFRYKWLVLLFLIAGGVGAWFYAQSLTPIYQSTGTMLISSNERAGDNEVSRIVSRTTGIGANATLANELQVLRSRAFAGQIAQKLYDEDAGGPDEFPVLWRENDEGEMVRASIEAVTNRVRNGLDFQLVNRDSEVIQITFLSASPAETARIINEAMDVYIERSTIQNRQAAEYTTEFLDKERAELKQQLEASEARLKEFMDNTGIVRVDNQATNAVTRREQIKAELEEVELDLESIDLAIRDQEQELERIRPGLANDFSDAIAPRIRSYQEALGEYERERFLILSRNPGVRDREVTPPRLKYLDDQIETLKSEISELSEQIFSEEDEYMGMESAERTRMVTEIQTRLVDLRMQKNQLESRREVLRERGNQAEQSFQNLPDEMIRLARLQREVEMNEQLYLGVSRQYADMSTWKETQFGYGHIIDQATVPGYPVSPNQVLLMVMGVVLGGLVAGAFITIKEFFDTSINSVDHLKGYRLPMLAAVPSFNSVPNGSANKHFRVGDGKIPTEMVLLRDRSNIVSESIRRLKNNIIYQNSDRAPKTIAITSAEKGDGKSTIVCNLAVAFAEDGYKTLLIDSDFRRPKVHSYFGFSNRVGLSNYLHGGLQIAEVINDSELNNLKIVTAGSQNDRPDSMVSSEPFNQFLERMEKVFDVIILDTPPYGIISDSTALLKRVDATVVVAKYRKTSRAVFLHTIEELERINANVSGLVLNDFDPKKETGSHYGTGYHRSLYSGYESYAKH